MSTVLAIPFRVDGRGFFAHTSEPHEVVEQQILDYLLTNYGERVGRPGYGANIRALLFQNINASIDADRERIKAELNLQLVIADVLSVSFQEESIGVLRITVVYRLIPQQETRTLVYILNGLVTEETP